MRISDIELKKVLQVGVLAPAEELGIASPKPTDWRLIARLVGEVIAMPDRDDVVADLKARIEAGTYNPTGEEIADAMIRRAVADRMH
ncbi:MAG TPA: flagellar biosynthesis anti-sigma factor FlgM [Fimbriimonadaceae bacterium]|nr:flagellar biosynthesis anti-sigma factor FlgM [Fimbriimonadaceae bacterium]